MTSSFGLARSGADARHSAWTNRLRTRLLSELLARLPVGHLEVTWPDGSVRTFGHACAEPHGRLQLLSWHAVDRMLLGGALGFAEAYIDGQCAADSLEALFDLAVLNERAGQAQLAGPGLRTLASRVHHWLRTNTRRGSRDNIAFHYDLGNDFYARWLDETMSYSAAKFDSPEQDLASAQLEKYRHACRELRVARGDRILEIGCGWGGFAEVAAREFGAVVHGVTLSRAQLAYAARRMQRAGVADRVTLSLTDYRDVRGAYDHVVSIEMFEAVGQRYWKTFCRRLRERLRPGGRAFLQIITIRDDLFDAYAARPDFIQRFVFPGGMLPSPQRLEALFKAGKLGLERVEFAAEDYARTLRTWQHAFESAWPDIEGDRFDTRFKRLWQYYLKYCEAGFRHGIIDLGRFLLTRSG